MTIREYLKIKKISHTELAIRLGIRKQTISSQLKHWENGGLPTLKTIKLWSEALEITQQEFINLFSK